MRAHTHTQSQSLPVLGTGHVKANGYMATWIVQRPRMLGTRWDGWGGIVGHAKEFGFFFFKCSVLPL